MKSNDSLIIMNFTGCYEKEDFYEQVPAIFLSFKHLKGTYGYCDETAAASISEAITPYSPYGIHFIDSGNYHYISKLWIDRIDVPFILCVFDHHSDLNSPAFGNLLSCGDWVREALKTNPWLQKVILIGTSKQFVHSIDPALKDKIVFYTDDYLHTQEGFCTFANEQLTLPIYLSIDKDVLDPKVAVSDWDQGSLTLEELKLLLYLINEKAVVLGADICGECTQHLSALTTAWEEKQNQTNQELLRFLLELKDHFHSELL